MPIPTFAKADEQWENGTHGYPRIVKSPDGDDYMVLYASGESSNMSLTQAKKHLHCVTAGHGEGSWFKNKKAWEEGESGDGLSAKKTVKGVTYVHNANTCKWQKLSKAKWHPDNPQSYESKLKKKKKLARQTKRKSKQKSKPKAKSYDPFNIGLTSSKSKVKSNDPFNIAW